MAENYIRVSVEIGGSICTCALRTILSKIKALAKFVDDKIRILAEKESPPEYQSAGIVDGNQ